MRVETRPDDPHPAEGDSDTLAARLAGPRDASRIGFHVALDTIAATRLRADPHLVRIPGFALLDTGDYQPVLALVTLELFWRMQGMDMLARTRGANQERRARPRRLPMTGSVWLVEGALDAASQQDPGERAVEPGSTGPAPNAKRRPASLRIDVVHALDRVSIGPRGPRHIETIDVQTMLPRFTEKP